MNASSMTFASLCALLSLAGPCTAAELYRWQDSRGSVHYGDRPPPGAALDKRLDPHGSVSSIPSDIDLPAIEAARERARQRSEALARAHQAVIDAQADYAGARARRERGVEPLPGERLGTATGGSRLAPSYFARLNTLDQAVAQARARLDEAIATRNALR